MEELAINTSWQVEWIQMMQETEWTKETSTTLITFTLGWLSNSLENNQMVKCRSRELKTVLSSSMQYPRIQRYGKVVTNRLMKKRNYNKSRLILSRMQAVEASWWSVTWLGWPCLLGVWPTYTRNRMASISSRIGRAKVNPEKVSKEHLNNLWEILRISICLRCVMRLSRTNVW